MPEKISVLRNGTSWKNALFYGMTLGLCTFGNIFDKLLLPIVVLLTILFFALLLGKLKFSRAKILETQTGKTVLGFVMLFLALFVPSLAKDSGNLSLEWFVVGASTILFILASRYFIPFQHQLPRENYQNALEDQAYQDERHRLYRKGTLK